MRSLKYIGLAAMGMSVVILLGMAQEAESFDFMPRGGAELLLRVLDNCATCDGIAIIVTTEKTQDDWRAYFTAQGSTLEGLTEEQRKEGALAGLTEEQVNTLLAYLTLNVPMPAEDLPKDTQEIDWANVLPADGFNLVLGNCQSCHTIAVAATGEFDVQGWYAIFRYTDHSQNIYISDQQWEEMANYLSINMPIPEEDIPEELREGQGTY